MLSASSSSNSSLSLPFFSCEPQNRKKLRKRTSERRAKIALFLIACQGPNSSPTASPPMTTTGHKGSVSLSLPTDLWSPVYVAKQKVNAEDLLWDVFVASLIGLDLDAQQISECKRMVKGMLIDKKKGQLHPPASPKTPHAQATFIPATTTQHAVEKKEGLVKVIALAKPKPRPKSGDYSPPAPSRGSEGRQSLKEAEPPHLRHTTDGESPRAPPEKQWLGASQRELQIIVSLQREIQVKR